MEIIKILEQVVSDFAAAIPNIVGAIIVVLFGWILGKIFAKTIKTILSKVGADTAAEHLNNTDFAKQAKLKIIPSTLISKVVYYVILLITLLMATEVLQMPVFSQMMADLIGYLPNIFAALILFILGILLADFIKNITYTTCSSLGIPSSKLIANFIFYLVFLTLTITALEQAKISTDLISTNLTIIISGLVASFAIGYGFASKDTMSNFLASFYTKNKIKIGDIIRIGNVSGEVVSMDTSAITIQSENRLVVIPLRKLSNENIEILQN